MEKFIQKLNSGTFDPESEKRYDVTVEFHLKNKKVFEDDAKKRITNMARFIVSRILPMGTKVKIAFSEFDLILEKIRKPLNTEEYDQEKKLFSNNEFDLEEEVNCLPDSVDQNEEQSTEESNSSSNEAKGETLYKDKYITDLLYKYIFPKGPQDMLFYDLSETFTQFKNKQQEYLDEDNWEEYCLMVTYVLNTFKIRMFSMYCLYEIFFNLMPDEERYEMFSNIVLKEDVVYFFWKRLNLLKDYLEALSGLRSDLKFTNIRLNDHLYKEF